MPVVVVNMLSGRSDKKKAELMRRVSEAVSGSLEVGLDHVRVILNEVPKSNWSVAGLPIEEYLKNK